MEKKMMIMVGAVVAVIAVVCVAAVVVLNNDNDDEGKLLGKVYTDTDLPSDSRLWVFGNANGDDRIDNADVKYVEDVIAGKATMTKFCDANADGTVDGADVSLIKKIMNKDKIDVYYVDNYYTVAKVSWPVESIAIGYCSGAYTADITGLCGKVKMVDTTISTYWNEMNSNFRSAKSFGTTEDPDCEEMMKQKIDVYVVGYFDANADLLTPGKLNKAGIDVMFMSTADNSGVSYPNEHIDRAILMFGFLLQGDMDKTYRYLEWHDNVLNKLKVAGAKMKDNQASFIMSRSSWSYADTTISITGKNNTNNLHAEWVGVYAAGQHSALTPLNYNKLSTEQVLTLIKNEAKNNKIYFMYNDHDGMRNQRSLVAGYNADKVKLSSSPVKINYMGMAREAGNSPMYVVELAFYQNVLYPGLSAETGIDYKVLFNEYLTKFSSENYYSGLDINKFFVNHGVPS